MTLRRMPREKKMEYEFTLKYQLADEDCDLDELVERLGAGGCDDALIGIGQPGRIGLKFTREAASAMDALKSAMMDMRAIVPTARLAEAGPDYVGLTDVAEMVGMTRQNLRKLMVTNVSSFPLPLHEGSSGVWHLADLLNWLHARDYQIEHHVHEMSQATRQLNATKEALRIAPDVQEAMAGLLT
jgi:hypothetical protein